MRIPNIKLQKFSIYDNYWILILFFFLPFNYALTIDFLFPLKLSEIALIFLITLLVIYPEPIPLLNLKDKPTKVLIILTISIIVSTVINLVWAYPYPFKTIPYRISPRIDGILKFIYFIFDILLFFIATIVFRTDKDKYLTIFLKGSFIAGLYCWYLFASSIFGYAPILLPGMDENPQFISLSIGKFIRCGTFKEGNYMGVYLLVCYVIAKYQRNKMLSRFFFFTIIPTFSTVAFFGALFFYISFNLKKNFTRKKLPILLLFLTLLPVALFVLYQNKDFRYLVVSKVVSGTDKYLEDSYSKTDRLNSVKISFQQGIDNPLLGVGLSNYGLHYDRYNKHTFFTYKNFKPIPNNIYMEIFSETGILGFLIFSIFIFSLFQKSKQDKSNILRIGLISLLICFIAFPTFSVFFIWIYFALINSLPHQEVKLLQA